MAVPMATLAAVPEGQCDVTIYRAATGALQTFTLRTGGVLRIGRGVANDIILDFNGVSVYHAELYLRPAEAGEAAAGMQMLCIRDDSKNGTGVRPGPHAPDSDPKKPATTWEAVQKGALRVLDHGWQMMVPLRSRKESAQLPESWRVLTVYTGTKIGPLVPDEEIDGELWEPALGRAPSLKATVTTGKEASDVPPPPADLGGGAFEEAPPPPEGEEDSADRRRREKEGRKREKKERKEKDKREREEREAKEREEREREERKRAKKEKKAAKKKDRDQSDDDKAEEERKRREEEEERERERQERKREKKEKKAKKRQDEEKRKGRDEDEGEDESAPEDDAKAARAKRKEGRKKADEDEEETAETRAVQARDREARERVAYLAELDKSRREREERQRLEKELEAELAELPKAKKKDDKKDQEPEEDRTLAPTSPAPGAPTSPAPGGVEPTSPAPMVEEETAATAKQTPKKAKGPDQESGEEDKDEVTAAWDKALAPADAAAKPAASKAVPTSPVATEPGEPEDVKQKAPAPEPVQETKEIHVAVVVKGEDKHGAGLFLLCGTHTGKPMYRRMMDEKEPSYLYFWDGDGDASCAGWYIAGHPSKADNDSYMDFWKTAGDLPAEGKGDAGGTMEAHMALEGPSIEALKALPEAMRKEFREAYVTARAGREGAELPPEEVLAPQRGVAEEEVTEAVATAGDVVMANSADQKEAHPSLNEREEQGKPHEGEVDAAAATTAAAQKGEAGAKEKSDEGEPSSGAPPQAEVATSGGPAAEVPEGAKVVAAEATAQPSGVSVAVTEVASEAPPAPEAKASEDAAQPAPASPSVPSRRSPTPARTEATKGQTVHADPTEVAPTEGGASDAEAMALAKGGTDGAPGGLTAAALAEHSKAMPPIGGKNATAQNKAPATPRSEAGRSVIAASAIAPSAVAPSIAPTVRTFRTHGTGEEAHHGAAGLTAEALAKHSEKLPPIGGPGDDFAKSTGAEMKSAAGKSLGGATEMTFRTHMTTRSLLVGASVMRELMRSVSPISEPGVNIKRKRRDADTSPKSGAGRRKKKKKKDKKEKEKAHRTADSASHWQGKSPTPFSRKTEAASRTEGAPSAVPSHWKAGTRTSATPGDRETHAPSESDGPPVEPARKKAKAAKQLTRMETVSPCTGSPTPFREPPVTEKKPKARLEKRKREEDADKADGVGGARPKKLPKEGKEKKEKKGDKEAKRKKRSTSRGKRH